MNVFENTVANITELTIWVDPRLASWLSTQAARNSCSRHRYVEKALAKLMEDQLSRGPEDDVNESSYMPE